MKVILKTICSDAFHTRESGNLNIIGIFDSIGAGKFPAIHPKMTFVFVLQGDPLEDYDHSMTLIGPKKDKPFNTPVSKGKIGVNGRGHLVLHMVNVKLPDEGIYTAEFKIGDVKDSIQFNVTLPPNSKK